MGNERAQRLGTKTQISAPTFEPEKLTLITDKNHPLYDKRIEKPVPAWLVKSIKKFGVQDPIKILLDGKKENGDPNVIVTDGRQRTRGLILANKELSEEGKPTYKIPAIQVYGTYAEVLAKSTVLSNEQRIATTAIWRSEMARRMHANGDSKEDIATVLGVELATVYNLLKLLDCSKKVQDAVESELISIDMAKTMSEMSRAEQDAALEKMLAEGGSLKGKKGKKKLAKAANKPHLEDLFIGKKGIRTLIDGVRATIKSGHEDDEVCLPSIEKVLAFILGERKRCPVTLVEVTTTEEKSAPKGKGKKRGRPKGSKNKKAAEVEIEESEESEDDTVSYDHSTDEDDDDDMAEVG